MRTLGPFAVPALDTSVLVGSQSGLCVGVEVTNLSGSLLRIEIGSHQEWLPAYRVQRYAMSDENSVHIVNAGVEIAGAPENQILVVAAYTNDAPNYLAAFPGTYPQDISRATTVAISGGSINATIIGTPSVSISSGTVNATISGTPNINIQSQSVNVVTIQPPSALANLVFPASVNSTQTTAVVPSGTHTLKLTNNTNVLNGLVVRGHTTQNRFYPRDVAVASPAFFLNRQLMIAVDSAVDTQFDINATEPNGVPVTVAVEAILDSQTTDISNLQGNPIFTAHMGYVTGSNAIVTGVGAPIAPYNAQGTSAPATGSQATVTLAANGTKSYRAAMLSHSKTQTGATAGNSGCQLKDGATIIHNRNMGVPVTTGNSAGETAGDLALIGTVNTALTWGFAAADTTVAQAVTVGAYLQ